MIGSFALDAAQGVSKLVANLSYILPFLSPVAPAAGIFTFLLPWIKNFYNVYVNYKYNKEKFVYSNMSFSDFAKLYFANKLANKLI
jgi:hypothetical protein